MWVPAIALACIEIGGQLPPDTDSRPPVTLVPAPRIKRLSCPPIATPGGTSTWQVAPL